VREAARRAGPSAAADSCWSGRVVGDYSVETAAAASDKLRYVTDTRSEVVDRRCLRPLYNVGVPLSSTAPGHAGSHNGGSTNGW